METQLEVTVCWENCKAPFEDDNYRGKTMKQNDNPIPPAQYDETEEWVKDYTDQFGEEPSFF